MKGYAKDFNAIAAAIKSAECTDPVYDEHFINGVNAARRDIAYEMAGLLAASNPKFDKARFIEACGLLD